VVKQFINFEPAQTDSHPEF